MSFSLADKQSGKKAYCTFLKECLPTTTSSATTLTKRKYERIFLHNTADENVKLCRRTDLISSLGARSSQFARCGMIIHFLNRLPSALSLNIQQ